MVTNELLSEGNVIINGDRVRARQVANQIALRDAIQKQDVQKVFTFHKTVKSAASFVADGSEGIQSHLPDFDAYHVSGEMLTSKRDRVMKAFRAASKAVISNARCLTEGVDVPAVDMVAFLSPRRSRVDIVQAVGRAMRTAPGKSIGYVLVPLYLELNAGESLESAVERASFGEIWDVLQSLQEQDEALAELIRDAGEKKGQSLGFDDRAFADIIEFDTHGLTLETLRKAVATRCIESLYSSWDTWFGKLKDFKERFEHCNVETGWAEDPGLASWVSSQRSLHSRGALDPQRITRLNELGFIWDWQSVKSDQVWMQSYQALVKYVEANGDPHVPARYKIDKLGQWVWIQRQRRRGKHPSGPLSSEQISLLDKLGFRWEARADEWSDCFDKLKRFKEESGHCEVDTDKKLANWVKRQRTEYSKGTLSKERVELLNSIGLAWDGGISVMHWNEMYDQLKAYFAQHGDSDVPSRWKVNKPLASWVNNQREKYKSNALSAGQIQLLTI